MINVIVYLNTWNMYVLPTWNVPSKPTKTILPNPRYLIIIIFYILYNYMGNIHWI